MDTRFREGARFERSRNVTGVMDGDNGTQTETTVCGGVLEGIR